MSLNDCDLMDLALTTRFTHTADGRISYENEPGGWRAPPFVFARTVLGNLWRVRDDLDHDLVHHLTGLAAAEPVRPDLRAAPDQLAEYRRVLGSDGEPADVDRGPHYWFPRDLPLLDSTIAITVENWDVMEHMVSDVDTFRAEFAGRQPRRAIVVDEKAVSVCWSARRSDRAAEAGVETLAAYRGQGHAVAVVAAWAQDVRASGRIPLYGTSWANTASQVVAQKLGLVPYGSIWDIG